MGSRLVWMVMQGALVWLDEHGGWVAAMAAVMLMVQASLCI